MATSKQRFWSRFREKDWRQTAKVIFHQVYGLSSRQEVLGHGEICLVLLCFFSPPSVWYIFKQNFIFKIKVLQRWYLNYTPAIWPLFYCIVPVICILHNKIDRWLLQKAGCHREHKQLSPRMFPLNSHCGPFTCAFFTLVVCLNLDSLALQGGE